MKILTLSYGSSQLRLIQTRLPSTLGKTNPIYQIAGEETLVAPTGQLYLHFSSADQISALAHEHSLTLTERISDTEYIASIPSDAVQWAAEHQSQPALKIVEPILKATATQWSFQMPTDHLLSSQWYLQNDGIDRLNGKHWCFRKHADAKVIEAWKILAKTIGQTGSSDITIAVIDKGFDIKHPDFEGKIVHPKDFFNPSNAQFRFSVSPDPMGQLTTNADHGTACAGIALAQANGKGIVGVAPNARFMPIQYNSASALDLRRMFRYIMEHGGDVISCSFGTRGLPMDSLTAKVIHDCATKGRNGKGCVICFATGNDAEMLQDHEIATHPDVIAVGASTSEDTFAPYTNRTLNMSVVAPGGYGFSGLMTTTDPGFEADDSMGTSKSVGKGTADTPFYRMNAEGTSFACPLVAGVAALLLSVNPDLTAKEVKQIIEDTADRIGPASDYDANGHSVQFGYGRINAANAVRKALGQPLKRYRRAAKPKLDMVSPFQLKLGTILKDQLRKTEEEVTFRYSVPKRLRGHTLVVELETAIDHDPKKMLALFVQKDQKPDFTGDFMNQVLMNDDLRARLLVQDLSVGDYFISVRCLHKTQFQWIKGGGPFELTFRIEQAIVDEPSDGAIFADVDGGSVGRVS